MLKNFDFLSQFSTSKINFLYQQLTFQIIVKQAKPFFLLNLCIFIIFEQLYSLKVKIMKSVKNQFGFSYFDIFKKVIFSQGIMKEETWRAVHIAIPPTGQGHFGRVWQYYTLISAELNRPKQGYRGQTSSPRFLFYYSLVMNHTISFSELSKF